MNIEIICGPMYSGKSTELLRRCKQYQAIGCKILLINHSYDTRCDDVVKTHSNLKMDALKTNTLMSIDGNLLQNNVIIAIDEAQFFSDLHDFVVKYENILNTTLLVSGLDGDFKKCKFGSILDIIPYSNSVTKLNAMCMMCKDGTLAPFTKRKIICEDKILVGASESYMSVCRKCFSELN